MRNVIRHNLQEFEVFAVVRNVILHLIRHKYPTSLVLYKVGSHSRYFFSRRKVKYCHKIIPPIALPKSQLPIISSSSLINQTSVASCCILRIVLRKHLDVSAFWYLVKGCGNALRLLSIERIHCQIIALMQYNAAFTHKGKLSAGRKAHFHSVIGVKRKHFHRKAVGKGRSASITQIRSNDNVRLLFLTWLCAVLFAQNRLVAQLKAKLSSCNNILMRDFEVRNLSAVQPNLRYVFLFICIGSCD